MSPAGGRGRAGAAACLAALVALALAGCPARTSRYAPRLHDTDFHRDALERKSCADCHDPARVPHHAPQDDCTSCHTICRGC